jgi:glycosyltransferase involved in cell wall biosynthesis
LDLNFSIIVPVYNRPIEIDELLESLTQQDFKDDFQVVIIEDGSDLSSAEVVMSYKDKLNVDFYFKDNSGPGLSRNFGMQKATGNYFIILDSDCVLPNTYLKKVKNGLVSNFTDAFGGPDASHKSFTTIQKAINYAMTSFLTTGGIRGNKNSVNTFQPRSFNMGISRVAFQKTNGFGSQRYGEDIDLSLRLLQNNFKTQLISEAFVYHKRRSTLKQFFNQTFNFGAARPILNQQHPSTSKITYWFPSLFVMGLVCSVVFLLMGTSYFLWFYGFYLSLIFIDAFLQNKSIAVAGFSIITTIVQFFGYGLGFLRSSFRLQLGKSITATFPEMFK